MNEKWREDEGKDESEDESEDRSKEGTEDVDEDKKVSECMETKRLQRKRRMV